MPVVALFGITNSGLNLFVNLVILFLVVVWIALIAWTFLDARRRIQDPVLVACATGASLFPFVGTIVYSILRPPEFIEDARERELEIRASELRVKRLEEQSCPNCAYPIERTYLRCPNCRARVKDPCENCERPIDPRWSLCPYCETPVRRAAPEERPQPTAERVRQTAPERRAPRSKKAPEPEAKPAQRKRARKAPTSRQSRSPRTATQRATAAKQRQAGKASDAPTSTTGDDERRPAPAS